MIIEDIMDAREGDIATVEYGSTTITGTLRREGTGGLGILGADDRHILRVRTYSGHAPVGVQITRIERKVRIGDLVAPPGYLWRPVGPGHDYSSAAVVVTVAKSSQDLAGQAWGLFRKEDV